MTLEVQLEKIAQKKELLEAQWGDVKSELIEGGLKIQDSTFDEFISGLKDLDRITSGNKIIKDSYNFLRQHNSAVKLYYNHLKNVVAGLEGIIEEQNTLLEENKPILDIYTKLKAECNDKNIDVYLLELKSKIEESNNKIVGLEELMGKYKNMVGDIRFGCLMFDDYEKLIEWINRVSERSGIDLKIEIKSKQTTDKEEVSEEKQAEVSSEYNYVFEEGKANYIQRLENYFGMTEKQRSNVNKPSLVLFVSGLCNRDSVPKEQATILKKKAREIGDKLYYAAEMKSRMPPSIVESSEPLIIDKENAKS